MSILLPGVEQPTAGDHEPLTAQDPGAEHRDPEPPGESGPGNRTARQPGRFRLPHGLTSARFVVLVGLALAAGLVALLAVNTALAAGAIRLSGLESKLARTTEQREALQATVEGVSSPASLQSAAVALGMVPAAAPAFLDPATGRISGALTPAEAPAEPPVQAPQVTAPEPTASPAPSADPSAPAPTGPPSTAPTAPAPTLPADPGADGAVITRGSGDGAARPALPAPTVVRPAPAPTGDSATLVPGED